VQILDEDSTKESTDTDSEVNQSIDESDKSNSDDQNDDANLLGGRGRHGSRRTSEYVTRDLTKGSISRNLWFLAWPQMIEGLLNVLDRVADLFWAGRFFGIHAIGGLAIAQLYTGLIMTGRQGLDMGMQAMIARAVGGGNIKLANHVALQALTITAVFSLLMVAVGVLYTDSLLNIMGVSQGVIEVTSLYMQIQFVGFAGQAFRMMTGGALQASGDTLTPMKATTISRIVHIILSPILIFGWFGLPELGLPGAAWGNVIAQFLGVMWNFWALFAGTSRLHLTLKGYYFDGPLLIRLIRIGLPASGTGMERSIVHLLLARLVTPFGDLALAAYGITRNLELFTAMGSMGLGRASGTLVGQNLGAGRPDRARQAIWWSIAYITLIRGSLGIILMIFPVFFITIFSGNKDLVEVAIWWVRIQALSGLVMGSGMVFTQSFNVAGDTMAPMIVTFIAMVAVELPLAFVLSQWTPLGQYGIPIAITVAMVVRTAVYFPYFLKGRWSRVNPLG
tara:strand:- start:2030 stop:3547 length:1518 start_codon:yes stop_codon:yes gene_type:complete